MHQFLVIFLPSHCIECQHNKMVYKLRTLLKRKGVEDFKRVAPNLFDLKKTFVRTLTSLKKINVICVQFLIESFIMRLFVLTPSELIEINRRRPAPEKHKQPGPNFHKKLKSLSPIGQKKIGSTFNSKICDDPLDIIILRSM